ncbi:hypothetical protein BZA77DRAFT_21890 [Pyronema omphalodes]|nr:hypothetical protein BZA77DRAFT_21890 [Pyronema omphalodes]
MRFFALLPIFAALASATATATAPQEPVVSGDSSVKASADNSVSSTSGSSSDNFSSGSGSSSSDSSISSDSGSSISSDSGSSSGSINAHSSSSGSVSSDKSSDKSSSGSSSSSSSDNNLNSLAGIGQYESMPGVSALMAAYSKYTTASGFSAFQSGMMDVALGYAATGITAFPSATDPAVLATDPAMLSLVSGIQGAVSKYVATQTYLASDVKSSLAADLSKAAKSANLIGPTKTGSAGPDGTGIAVQETAGGAVHKVEVMGMGAVIAAGIIGVMMM